MQLNTNFISLPKKVVLETYEKPEEGQYYHKCTFAIPMDIPGGKGNSYHVVLNEVLFRNTHPNLEAGDYFKVIFSENVAEPGQQPDYVDDIYSFPVKENHYWTSIDNFITDLNQNLTKIGVPHSFFVSKISDGNVPYSQTTGGIICQASEKFRLEYSNNFGYLLNNLNKSISSLTPSEVQSYSAADCQYVKSLPNTTNLVVFPSLRFNGPFNYYIRTNLISQVPTYNEIGQTFNMCLATYNTTYYTGEFVQMASTMINLGQNITNITIELVNDFLEPIHIQSPMHVMLTVTPDLRSNDNSSYYQQS